MMGEMVKIHALCLLAGILLDLLIGDPHFLPHPVKAIGSLILFLEKKLLGMEPEKKAGDQKKERRRGALLWVMVVLLSFAATFFCMIAAYRINRYAGVILEVVLTCYLLAAGSLYRESMAVYRKLRDNKIIEARQALSMIVGRDTAELDEEEIIKAAVETVAENASDGVIAPLFFTALGGPAFGMLYKAVNTMDSMIGYKNERYKDFGFFAAKADDLFNFIPSRLSALCMIAGCAFLSIFSSDYNLRNAWRIFKRDRKNHLSPNSAQTESVCAGALGLKLGGTHLYQGIPVEKPSIGDEKKRTDIEDIRRANRLMFAAEAVAVIILMLIVSVLWIR